MTERWDQRVDRMAKPAHQYVSVVPLAIRILLIAGTLALTFYWVFTDGGLYAPIGDFFGSMKLGFLISWLALLAPTLVLVYGTAALIHRRRRKQREADFPSARIHQ